MVQAVHSYHFMSYTVTELFETKPENPIFYIRIWLLRLKLFFLKTTRAYVPNRNQQKTLLTNILHENTYVPIPMLDTGICLCCTRCRAHTT